MRHLPSDHLRYTFRRRIGGPPMLASRAWPGSDLPQKPASKSRSFPTASTADQKAGVVSSMIVFLTGGVTSPFSPKYASRPAYFPLYRLSSMFHSMKVFM